MTETFAAPSDPTARPIFMKQSYVWVLLLSGLGLVFFASWVLATEWSSRDRNQWVLILLLGLGLATLGGHRKRRPLLWIGQQSVLLPGEGELQWSEVQGVAIESAGGYSSAILVPRDQSLRPKLNFVKELIRRFSSWSVGYPVWNGFSMNALRLSDLEHIQHILENNDIPLLEPKKRWWRRLMGFLGP